jgi:tetratricopeptide (TPR) repeat protein
VRLQADLIRHVRSLGLNHSYPSFEECLDILAQPSSNGPRLIIYDNVDNPQLNIRSFIPQSDHCVIIITSRIRSMGQISPESHLELEVMSVEESVELLARGTGRTLPLSDNDQEETIAIARELGFLPIALKQACSYMYQTKNPGSTYLTRIQQNKNILLTEPVTYQFDMRYTSTYAAFDASYEMLGVEDRKLIHLLSFFSWANFPLELITLAAEHRFSTYGEELIEPGEDYDAGISVLSEIFCPSGEWNPVTLDRMMVSLQNYSLVTLVPNVDTVLLQLHPITHTWAAFKLAAGARPAYKCAAVLLLSMGARRGHSSLEKYLPSHVYHMAPLWDTLQPNDQWAFACILLNSGNFADSAHLQKNVVDHLRIYLEPLDENFLMACRRLAYTYLRGKDHRKAEQIQDELVSIMKTGLGDALLDDITGVEVLADTYKASHQYEKAAEMEEEALKQSKEVNGEFHPHTLGLLTDLGRSYSALGDYAKAEQVETEVMMKNVQVFGEDHPRTIGSCRNLARTYGNQGRYVEAEGLLRNALERSRKVCGEHHQRTLMTMYVLANALYRQLKTAESLELLSEIESLEAKAPGGNPEMLQKVRKLRLRILDPNRTESHDTLPGVGIDIQGVEKQQKRLGLAIKSIFS